MVYDRQFMHPAARVGGAQHLADHLFHIFDRGLGCDVEDLYDTGTATQLLSLSASS